MLVEFSVPEASLEHLRLVADAGARAVIGTTGFSAAQREEIAALARRAAILVAPNMSVAVTLAFKVLAIMAKALGDDYDIEITEIHHRFKKDAPSGTAVRMAEVVAEALGRDLDQVGVYGRQGLPGERTGKEIGVMSLRSGDVVGEHTVSFGTLGERLELTHRAHSRDTFARGALRAVRWMVGRPPGLYSMHDVLGIA
jgi:4-hydroxy-tetrahydrodipicolinate reductase